MKRAPLQRSQMKRSSKPMKRTPLARGTSRMKRSRLNRRSKSPRAVQEHIMDRKMQEIAVARGKCALCPSKWGLAGHHLIPRSYRKYRHVEQNILTVCTKCHRKADEDRAWFAAMLFIEDPELSDWVDENMVRAHQGLGPETKGTP